MEDLTCRYQTETTEDTHSRVAKKKTLNSVDPNMTRRESFEKSERGRWVSRSYGIKDGEFLDPEDEDPGRPAKTKRNEVLECT